MLTKIQDLTLDEIRLKVAIALRTGLDLDALADFVAGVDWSGFDGAPSAVKTALGDLEAWLTAFEEGDLTIAELVARLVSVFPDERERARRVTSLPDDSLLLLGLRQRRATDVTAPTPQSSAPQRLAPPLAERDTPNLVAVA